MPDQPAAFMSYARFNDQNDDGWVSEFRERLSAEVRVQLGEEFPIFQDRKDIAWGQSWQKRIDEALDTATLLVVIITPGFFRSSACRTEVERFLARERELGRDDLILPVYYVSTPELDNPERGDTDELARVLRSRQFADWRELRFESLASAEARRAVAELAKRMRDTFWRPAAEPSSDLRERVYEAAGQSQSAEDAPAARVTAKTERAAHVTDPLVTDVQSEARQDRAQPLKPRMAQPLELRMIVVRDAETSEPVSQRRRQAKTFGGIVLAVVGGSAIESLRALGKRSSIDDRLRVVTMSEAAVLRFPVGHPRGRVVYVGHPVDPVTYYPMARFHTFLFEQKVAEALRLIRSLGADTVDVMRVEGWGSLFPGLKQVDVGDSPSQGNQIMERMRLKPSGIPAVPDDLVWLPHEPLWQTVVDARLNSGLTSFVFDVRSFDDYGVNARLVALIAKSGLEAGGPFVEHRMTVWRLQGTFAD
jgi:hypothetical protein